MRILEGRNFLFAKGKISLWKAVMVIPLSLLICWEFGILMTSGDSLGRNIAGAAGIFLTLGGSILVLLPRPLTQASVSASVNSPPRNPKHKH